MSRKDTNPKEALGIGKVPFHVLPCRVLGELGLGMMEGGRKYGTHNYRAMGVRMSTYYNAAMRHLMEWWEGEDIDPDSGLHHIVKAMTSLMVVRDSMHMGNVVDDRPIQLPAKLDSEYLNYKAKEIIKQYPECVKPFTQQDRGPQLGDRRMIDGEPSFFALVEKIKEELPAVSMDEYPFNIPPKKDYRAYFSHHIRGKKGNDATKEDMDANREDAQRVCNEVRELLPDWDIYCPADVDEVVGELFKSGAIGEKEILAADCEIISRRDAVIAYARDMHISGGMKVEIDYAVANNIPHMVFYSQPNAGTRDLIVQFAKDVEIYG